MIPKAEITLIEMCLYLDQDVQGLRTGLTGSAVSKL